MIEAIDKKLLKYIPKQLHPHITWLEHDKTNHVYFMGLKDNEGKEIDDISPMDNVAELRFMARQYVDIIKPKAVKPVKAPRMKQSKMNNATLNKMARGC